MASSICLLTVLFTIGFLAPNSIGSPEKSVPPEWLSAEPRDAIAVRGRALTLPCSTGPAAGNSSAVTWLRDDKELDLEGDDRRLVLPDGSLTIKKVQNKRSGESDEGSYRCLVSTQFGVIASSTGVIRIAGLSANFSLNPVSGTAREGGLLRLTCGIESVPPAQVRWLLDDVEVKEDDRRTVVDSAGEESSVLLVRSVRRTDSGSYRCKATNLLTKKSRLSAPAEVAVTDSTGEALPLSFLAPVATPGEVLVRLGDPLSLECSADGRPTPSLTWYFIPKGGDRGKVPLNKTHTGVNVVRFGNASMRHAGQYWCSGGVGPGRREERPLAVEVIAPPTIVHRPESKGFHAAKTVRFHCQATGYPIPEIVWLADGAPVRINGRIKHKTWTNESLNNRSSELLLSSTIVSDSGLYQCLARSSVGEATATARLWLNLSKMPPPPPPSQVVCQPINSTQVRLSWQMDSAAVNLRDIKAFSIHYSPSAGGDESQGVAGPMNRSALVEKLTPFTNYTFSVRVYTHTASDFSERAVCETHEAVPIAAPTVHLTVTSPNSVRVAWQPLASNQSRGVVTEYKVQWRLVRSHSTKVDQVGSDVLEYTITGLVPGERYEVRVLAATLGWPDLNLPYFPWTEFHMEPRGGDLPPAPRLTLQAVNSSVIHARWSLAGTAAASLLGFKLSVRKHNGQQAEPVLLPANATDYLMTGLDAESQYDVLVLGMTALGDGAVASASIHTLSSALAETTPRERSSFPEPPIGLEAEPVTAQSINLTWAPPPVPEYNATLYEVCYNPVQTSLGVNTAVMICLKSTKNELLVTGLKPFTLYEFRVRSHDALGRQSVFSQALECHTLQDVPSPVTEVVCTVVNRSTIVVSWKEPLVLNGVIRNYTVGYTTDLSIPVHRWRAKTVPGNQYSTEVTGLVVNTMYHVVVRAATDAGLSSYHDTQLVTISSRHVANTHVPDAETQPAAEGSHHLGIVVGLAIGLSCIALCTTCIVCRRRCVKQLRGGGATCAAGVRPPAQPGPPPPSNNGCQQPAQETHEMDWYSGLAVDSGWCNSASRHVDTKGHYPNGMVNGVRLSLLSNGRAPHVSSLRGSIHITENPRYEPNSSESPLLGLQSASSSRIESSTSINDASVEARSSDSNQALLSTRRKPSAELLDSDPEQPTVATVATVAPVAAAPRTITSSVLDNPEFRFSNAPEKRQMMKGAPVNGFHKPLSNGDVRHPRHPLPRPAQVSVP